MATTSADGLSVTTDTTLSGSGIGATEHSDVTTVDGSNNRVRTVKDKSANGTLLDVSQLTTSASGLSVVSKSNSRGLTGTSGNALFDHTVDSETSITNGVRTVSNTTWWGDQNLAHTGANTKLLSSTTTVTSADHQTVTTTVDSQGDGKVDQTVVSHVNGDGTTDTTATQTGYNLSTNAAITLAQSETIKSANGLSTTTWSDQTGVGFYNRRTTDVMTYNNDGSETEATDLRVINSSYSDKNTSNTNTTLLSSTTTTLSGNGLSKLTQHETIGSISAADVPTYVWQTSDDETTLNADGGQTEMVTKWYGVQDVAHDASGTTLKSVTKTVTSANDLSKTEWIDVNGAVGKSASDYAYNEKDTDVVSYDVDNSGAYTGATTETVSVFAESGTIGANHVADLLVSKTITKTSADQSTITVTQDFDGDGVVDKSLTKTLQADGSTVSTYSDFSPNFVAARDKSVVTTSANGLHKTTQYYGLSNGSNSVSLQETIDDSITLGADDSQTETVIAKDAAGNLIYQTATTTHSKTLTSSTVSTQTGVFASNTVTSSTSYATDGTQTFVRNNSYGSVLHDSTKTTTSADGTHVEVDRDVDGNGKNDWVGISQSRADGSTLQTIKDYAADGVTLKDEVVYTAWTDTSGTHKTTQRDTSGVLSAGSPVFDQTVTDTNVRLADGGSTDTVVYTNSGQTVTARAVTQQSASGLNVKQQFFTGSADTTLYRTVGEITTINADGSQTVSTSISDGAGHLQFRALTSTDSTGLKVSRSWDTAGSGTTFDQGETDNTIINADGSRTETKVDMNGNSLLSKTQTKTSANGLTITKMLDLGGTGAFTVRRVDTTANNVDGSYVETISEYNVAGNPNGAGKLKDSVVTTISADHLTKTIQRDADGDGVYEQTETITTGIDGSNIDVLIDKTAASTVKGKVTTTTSADGLLITALFDLDGDGTTDRTRTETKTVNGDGSQVDTVVEVDSDGTLHQKSVLTTSADGKTSTLNWDTNGAVDANKNAIYNQTQTSKTDLSGAVNIIASKVDGNGNSYTQTTTISADGRTKTVSYVDTLATQYVERYQQTTTNNIDGSQTVLTTDTQEKIVSGTKTGTNAFSDVYIINKTQSTGTVSADGLTTTTNSSLSSSGQFTVNESAFGAKIANGIDDSRALSSTGTSTDTSVKNIDGVTIQTTGNKDGGNTVSGKTKTSSSKYNNTVVTFSDDGTVDINSTGDGITLKTNGTVTTSGAGISIDIVGSNASATSSNAAITLESGVAGVTVKGSSNAVVGNGAGDSLTINGYKNTVTMSNGSLILATNNSATINGDANNIIEQGQTTLISSGANNNLNVSGSSNRATMSNGMIVVQTNADMTLSGDSNTVTLKGSGTTLTTTSSGTTIDMTGSSETVTTKGSAITIESGVATANVQGDGSNTINLVDSKTALNVSGRSNTVTVTGGTITLGSSASVTINGTSNIINESSNVNASDVVAMGTGNILNVTYGRHTATLADGSTVNVGTASQYGNLTLTGNGFNIKENGANSDVITSGTGIVLDILGANDTATVASGKITVEAGVSATLSGDSNTVALKGSGTTLKTYGNSTTIDMTGSSETVNTKGSAITIESGVTTAIVQGGGSNTINLVDSKTALNVSGQNNTVTMTGGTITLGSSASVTISGTSNTINETNNINASDVVAMGTGNILNVTYGRHTATLADGSTVNVGTASQYGNLTLTGNGFNIKENGANSDVITSGTGIVLDILGANDTATVASGKITVEAGASAKLTGDSNTITDRTSGIVTVSGSSGTIDVVSSGAHLISMTGGSVKLESGANATITGNNDTVTLLSGNTATVTGTGETYIFGKGAGQDTIAAPSGKNTGVVDFGANLTDENLWLVQSGNNLKIDILGTNDSLTINDWFGGTPAAAVQSFATTDGLKLDSQVAQLVSAMASYSSHNTGFNPTSATQMPSDTTLQNAIAAAWHH